MLMLIKCSFYSSEQVDKRPHSFLVKHCETSMNVCQGVYDMSRHSQFSVNQTAPLNANAKRMPNQELKL